MEKKYELVKEDTIKVLSKEIKTLYRIRALRDFYDVNEGDLGGYIEKEENLSHVGNCWIYYTAKVYDDARVCDDAMIFDNAKVYGDAFIFENARIMDQVEVFESAQVFGRVRLYDDVNVYGNARVCNDVSALGNAQICGHAIVSQFAKIYGKVKVQKCAEICGTALISGSAIIEDSDSVLTFHPIGSENGTLTAFMDTNGDIICTRGCFVGTVKEFGYAVNEKHGDTDCAKEYFMAISMIKNRFEKRKD